MNTNRFERTSKSSQGAYNHQNVILTLYVESTKDIASTARDLACECLGGLCAQSTYPGSDKKEPFVVTIVDIEKQSETSGDIKIAIPEFVFEKDNIPQILAISTGDIFGIRSIKSIRLRDILLPYSFFKENRGPAYGITGLRQALQIYNRPLLATTIRPCFGMKISEYLDRAYQVWTGGIDIILDHPALSDQEFNPFYDRVTRMIELRRKIEDELHVKKLYFPNISARMGEMYARGKFVRNLGGRGVLVDMLTVGYSGTQYVKEQEMGLLIHAHRVMHGAFTHTEKHGISMDVFARLGRIAGIDQLHVGSTLGKNEGSIQGILRINSILREGGHNIRPTMPFISGGLHAHHIPRIVEILGKDITIHMSSSIFGHAQGCREGARSVSSTLDDFISGFSLKGRNQSYPLNKQSSPSIKSESVSNNDTMPSSYVHALAVSKGLDLIKT